MKLIKMNNKTIEEEEEEEEGKNRTTRKRNGHDCIALHCIDLMNK